MSKKYKDMDEDSREALQNEIRRAAMPVLDDEYSSRTSERPKALEEYGLCATCKHIEYVATEFRVRLVSCEEVGSMYSEFELNTAEPVTDCTAHEERGRLTLRDMASMAILINPNPKVVGFKTPEEES